MTMSFLEMMPKEISDKMLSLLTPSELFQKCFALNKDFKIDVILQLMKRGESALDFQQKFLSHCLENPRLCAYLDEYTSKAAYALHALLKRPYLNKGTMELAVLQLHGLSRDKTRPITNAQFEALKIQLADKNKRIQRLACLNTITYGQQFTAEQAKELLK